MKLIDPVVAFFQILGSGLDWTWEHGWITFDASTTFRTSTLTVFRWMERPCASCRRTCSSTGFRRAAYHSILTSSCGFEEPSGFDETLWNPSLFRRLTRVPWDPLVTPPVSSVVWWDPLNTHQGSVTNQFPQRDQNPARTTWCSSRTFCPSSYVRLHPGVNSQWPA